MFFVAFVEMAIWECKLDTGWQPYDPSLAAKIENHYQNNATQYTFKRNHGRFMFSYCCDFDKMLQINTKNNKFREIRRLNQTTNDNSGVRWQCCADGGWLDFDLKLNGKLERAFRNGKICTFSRKISRHGKSFSYRCDWTRMKQVRGEISTQTATCRGINRRS